MGYNWGLAAILFLALSSAAETEPSDDYAVRIYPETSRTEVVLEVRTKKEFNEMCEMRPNEVLLRYEENSFRIELNHFTRTPGGPCTIVHGSLYSIVRFRKGAWFPNLNVGKYELFIDRKPAGVLVVTEFSAFIQRT